METFRIAFNCQPCWPISVLAHTICSIMIDFSCITTMLVLIKTSQVGLMPITASRPYGCFPPQCVLADLYTSLTHDAGHRWKLSSAELLLTAGRPAITQSLPAWTSATVLPCFAFCFCFSLSRMPAFGWSPGLPPCLLPYYISYSAWAQCTIWDAFTSSLHSHSCLEVTIETVRGLAPPPAVGLWTTAREHKMPVL